MRKIHDAIAVKIKLKLAVPEVADSVNRPEAARDIRRAGFNRMQVASERIFRESIAVRVRAEAETDVVSRHAVARDFVLVALVKRKSHRVFADLVLLQPAAVGRLKNQAISSITSI